MKYTNTAILQALLYQWQIVQYQYAMMTNEGKYY